MGTTTRGLPYPEPTDPVAQGAANIRALAEAVDPKLIDLKTVAAVHPYAAVPAAGSRFLLQGGAWTGPPDTYGSVTITFPQVFPVGVIAFLCIPVSAAHYVSINGRAAVTRTSASFIVFGAGGAFVPASQQVDLNWLAIGW